MKKEALKKPAKYLKGFAGVRKLDGLKEIPRYLSQFGRDDRVDYEKLYGILNAAFQKWGKPFSL